MDMNKAPREIIEKAKGQRVLVYTREGEVFEGTVVSVDKRLNLCIEQKKRKEEMIGIGDTIVIRSRSVLYLELYLEIRV